MLGMDVDQLKITQHVQDTGVSLMKARTSIGGQFATDDAIRLIIINSLDSKNRTNACKLKCQKLPQLYIFLLHSD